jgi:DHA1 family bicyclomycin/chloramphenicol resistance-like MFS transporter
MEMNNNNRVGPVSFAEFVALMALMMALIAYVIDAMLPGLPDIGRDLGVTQANDNQLIISLVFLGNAVGQLLFGPLSDSMGRKTGVYLGFAIFFAGCVVSIMASDLSVMLIGRFLQGVGLAAPRIVTVAIVRDCFEGREMARVMSFTMAVFIFVPAIAPAAGQLILLVADWRAIVASYLVMGVALLAWFAIRQPETLPVDRRAPLSLVRIGAALREIVTNRVVLTSTLAIGLISGAFLGYLSSAQQVFQEQYELGATFPFYFALTALSLGGASVMNGRMVILTGMRVLSSRSLTAMTLLSFCFLVFAYQFSGHPPFWAMMLYFLLLFFSLGFLFGNLNAMAMEPLGHIAGIGAALIGGISTLISVPLGIAIGQSYDGTLIPVVAGFAICGLLMMVVMGSSGLMRLTTD